MHKGRPFRIEQLLRPFGRADLYSFGWPAREYLMTDGAYDGTLADFITDPIPVLTFVDWDPDYQGGYYRGFLGSAPGNDMYVGFHFRANSTKDDVEGWVQTYIGSDACLNEPPTGQNHLPFIWNAVSLFPSTSTGPHWSELHPDHVVWEPKVY